MSGGEDELPQPPALASGVSQPEELLSVERLSTTFFTHDGHVPAVRGVSSKVRRGEVVGLVGESGSGKSVTARSIIGLRAAAWQDRRRPGDVQGPGPRRRLAQGAAANRHAGR